MKSKKMCLVPEVAIWEDAKHKDLLVAEIVLPGVKKSDAKVDVNSNGFCVKAQRDNYYYDSCFQTIVSIDPDKTTAHFEEGLLTLRMPEACETDNMQKVAID
jgi:HSP20 family molecular chaperone IbpA